MADKIYRYCNVQPADVRNTYYYIADFEVHPGDIVVFPFGYSNREKVGIVTDVDYFTSRNAPYPPNSTKHLDRLFGDSEDETLAAEKEMLQENRSKYVKPQELVEKLKIKGLLESNGVGGKKKTESKSKINSLVAKEQPESEISELKFQKVVTRDVSDGIVLSADGKTVDEFRISSGRGPMEIRIPDGVETIWDNAFIRVNFSKMYIPETVKNVGKYTFHTPTPAPVWECTLKDSVVEVEEGNPYFASDENGFYSICEGKKRLEFLFDKTITEYKAPDDVVSFSEYAFHNCKNLEKIILSPFTEEFDEYAIGNGSKVKEVFIPASVKKLIPKIWEARREGWNYASFCIAPDNKNFVQDEKAIYEVLDDGTLKLVSWTSARKGEAVLRKEVSEIGDTAFQGRKNITEVRLPEGLKVIGYEAFACSGIKKITVPETVRVIKSRAFSSCGNLTTVKLPSAADIDPEVLQFTWGVKELVFTGEKNIYNYEDERIVRINKDSDNVNADIYKRLDEYFDCFARGIVADVVKNSVDYKECKTDRAWFDKEKCEITLKTGFYQNTDSVIIKRERVECAEGLSAGDTVYIKYNNQWEIFSQEGKSLGFMDINVCKKLTLYAGLYKIDSVTVADIIPKSKRRGNAEYAKGSVIIKISRRNFAEELTEEDALLLDEYAYIVDDNYAYILKRKDGTSKKTATVPAVIEGKSVQEITGDIFRGDENLEEIVFSEGIRTLGESALFSIKTVKKIVLPSTLEYISADVFSSGNGYYKDLYIHNDLLFIAPAGSYSEIFIKKYRPDQYDVKYLNVVNDCSEKAIAEKEQLSVFRFEFHEDYVRAEIDYYEFENKKYEELTLPSEVNGVAVKEFNVSSVPNYLQKLYIPDTVTKLTGITNHSVRLSAIEISENNPAYDMDGMSLYSKDKKILYRVFRPYMTEYIVPEGTEIISSYAFKDAGEINRIVLPRTIRHIEDNAFYGCNYLEEIKGLEYVTSAGEKIFGKINVNWRSDVPFVDNRPVIIAGGKVWKYSDLTESVITLPEGITEIGEYAFGQFNIEDNVEQIILPDTVKVIKQGAFANRGKLKEINIPDGVTQINAEAFDGCYSLEKICLPATVENIDITAFPKGRTNCIFGEVAVDKDNPHYCIVDGMLLSGDKKALLYIPAGLGGKVTIPDSVVEIGAGAARGNRNITEVVFPENVKKIGDSAFEGCVNIFKVSFAEGLEKIGVEAFASTGLTRVLFPNTITEIGDGAFYYTSIYNVTLPEVAVNMGRRAFPGNTVIDNSKIESAHGKYYREMYRDAQRIFVVFRGSHAEIEQLENYLTTNKLKYDVETISGSISQLRLYDTDDTLTILKEFPHLTATGLSEEYWDVGIWFSDAGYGYYTDYVQGPDIDGHAEGGAGRWTWEISDITQSYRGWYRHMSSGEKDYVNYCYPFMDKWNRAGGIETESDSTDAEPAAERLYIKVKFENGKAYRYFCNYKVNIGDTVFVQGKLAGQEGTVAEIIDSQPTGQAEAYTLYVTSVKKNDE